MIINQIFFTMMFPFEKGTAVNLFNFINKLYENTSFMITTNKAPKQWAQMLGDEVLASACLTDCLSDVKYTFVGDRSL